MQAVLGILIGLPAGNAIGNVLIASISTDLYSMPAVIYPRTYFIAALLALVFIGIGQHGHPQNRTDRYGGSPEKPRLKRGERR